MYHKSTHVFSSDIYIVRESLHAFFKCYSFLNFNSTKYGGIKDSLLIYYSYMQCSSHLQTLLTFSLFSENEDRFEKSKTAGLLNRLAVLEARAHKRTTLVWKAYLPAMFFLFAFVLGKSSN